MSRLAILADDRGQTVLDYAIAAGIFFIALTFVLGFIPGMFAPFTGGENAQVADRYATSLVADQLGSPEKPYVLNETCTTAFFEQLQTGTNAPTTCRFDTTADTLTAMFATDPGMDLNVTIETVEGTTASLNGQTLAAGDPLPGSQGMTTARRAVHLSGQTYRLLVRVW